MAQKSVLVALVLFVFISPCHVDAQGVPGQQIGERIYKQAADSVFLLEILDENGQQVGSGSGFLVTDEQIVTNAHVADAGKIFVRFGPVRVECETQRIDRLNDLAMCRMPAKSDSPPLRFALKDPSPGVTIFAMGSPRGFEKTLTQGLFTGIREIEGRRVAQFSASISPGSSGGPILNSDGELVGVAVAVLKNAQNLNFAVPLDVVKSFIAGQAPLAGASFLDSAKALQASRDSTAFSTDQNSPYQKLDQQYRQVLIQGINETSDRTALSDAYELAGIFDADIQVAAARRLVGLTKPVTKNVLIDLARALYFATNATGQSPELDEAEQAITRAIALSRPSLGDLQLLGDIQYQAEKFTAAHSTYVKASILQGDAPDRADVLMSLFRTSQSLKRPAEAESWFKRIPQENLDASRWVEYARFLDDEARYSDAGDAWMVAFKKAPTQDTHLCEASVSYFYASDYDKALPGARQCIELAATKRNAERRTQLSHRIIAAMLNERGVYEDSLSHARQAVAIDVTDAQAHYLLAKALNNLRRFTEAMSAATSAIRLSDGKFASMHFELGKSYFSLKQWPEAMLAYEKAAELAPKDPVAPFNVAAAAYNNRAYDTALRWYREVQRRDANYEKDQVNRTIAELQQR